MKARVGVMWSTVLAIPLGMGLPADAAEVTNADRARVVSTGALVVPASFDWESLRRGDVATGALQTGTAVMQAMPPRKIGTSEKIGMIDSDAAQASNSRPVPIATHRGFVDPDPVAESQFERAIAETESQLPIKQAATKDRLMAHGNDPYFSPASDPAASNQLQLAQFELPRGTREGTGPSQREAREAELPKDLNFEYAYGSDSEFVYTRNPDLNKRVRDNSLLFAPTLFGLWTYRPYSWMETRLEMTLERVVALQEEKRIVLPNGDIQFAAKKQWSLLIDQAYVKFKDITDPFEFTVGRRNFEDGRLWLYDAALDAAIVKLNHGNFQTEVSASRENWLDMDVFVRVPRGHINNYIWYTEYRGIEDHKLAGYWIKRNDRKGLEGEPQYSGVRAYGRPSDEFNYWTELGFARGKDQLNLDLKGRAFDAGGTYRFKNLPRQLSITLGYAYGSGDSNDTDDKNTEFRQTGLQSNEARFGGVTQFKRYGEAFDPELSNLKISTVGFGFRPAPTVFVDLVYHRYRLNNIANEFRSSGITAEMNRVNTRLSRDVGSEIDVILGFRNMFGVRRLGFEVRAGIFLPGDAYLRNDGDDDNPIIRKPEKSISILAVIIY